MHDRLSSTLPPWRIVTPAPVEELQAIYMEAGAAFGVPWHHLAAINLVETGMGRIRGTSTAGAQGPMQFLPATWAAYGGGGDINGVHDSIFGAARYLAANGGASDITNALWNYNHSDHYVLGVMLYADLITENPNALRAAPLGRLVPDDDGDVYLPVGYERPRRSRSHDLPATFRRWKQSRRREPPRRVLRAHGPRRLRRRRRAVRRRGAGRRARHRAGRGADAVAAFYAGGTQPARRQPADQAPRGEHRSSTSTRLPAPPPARSSYLVLQAVAGPRPPARSSPGDTATRSSRRSASGASPSVGSSWTSWAICPATHLRPLICRRRHTDRLGWAWLRLPSTDTASTSHPAPTRPERERQPTSTAPPPFPSGGAAGRVEPAPASGAEGPLPGRPHFGTTAIPAQHHWILDTFMVVAGIVVLLLHFAWPTNDPFGSLARSCCRGFIGTSIVPRRLRGRGSP